MRALNSPCELHPAVKPISCKGQKGRQSANRIGKGQHGGKSCGDGQHYRDIEIEEYRANGDWRYDPGDTQNAKNIENVGTHNIADCDVRFAAQCCDHRGGKFGKACADSDDGQAYYSFANAEMASNIGCPGNQVIRADEQTNKTGS